MRWFDRFITLAVAWNNLYYFQKYSKVSQFHPKHLECWFELVLENTIKPISLKFKMKNVIKQEYSRNKNVNNSINVNVNSFRQKY